MFALKNLQKAHLLLSDGQLFEGISIGKIGTTGGEICFNTSMTGYQEIYTDPSYYGQIVVNTPSHIGNYGVCPEDNESDSTTVKGVVVNEFSFTFSRHLASGSLDEFLKKHNTVGIAGLDTRKIVRHIRKEGAMNAVISSENYDLAKLKKYVSEVPNMASLELSSKVSTQEPYFLGEENKGPKVAVLDLGVKKSILNNLVNRGCKLQIFPSKTTFETMEKWKPNGYFLSNGPGDPAAMANEVNTAKKIIKSQKPTFGICLGNQILARAVDIDTFKMHHGHRGANHPVKNILTGKCEITSQNHGFAVNLDSLHASEYAELTHIDLNDNTVEGLRLKDKPIFSVQHHPEAAPGPDDSKYLFDQFLTLLN